MPAAYHVDLRTKAILMSEKGIPKIEVCRMLQISRNTLWLCLKRVKEKGDPEPVKPRRRKIDVPKKFLNAVGCEPGVIQMRPTWGVISIPFGRTYLIVLIKLVWQLPYFIALIDECYS